MLSKHQYNLNEHASPNTIHQFKPKLDPDFKFNENGLEIFNQNKVKSLTKLTESRQDHPLIKKLYTPEMSNVREQLQNTLGATNTAEFTKAQGSYKESIQNHQAKITDIPKSYSIYALLNAYKTTTDTAREAIVQQETWEKNEFKKAFDKSATNLKAGGYNDNEIQELQELLMSELKTSQKTRSDAFFKSIEDTNNQIQQVQRKQAALFLYLRDIRTEGLTNLYDKDVQGAISAHEQDKKIDNLLDINLNEITELRRKTGNKISYKENADGSYSCEMKFGSRVFNSLYYLGENAEKDMLAMAKRIKAEGSDELTIDLDFKNEKIATQRAQEAFRAAVKAGFEPKDITINVSVNGVPINIYKEDQADKKNETTKPFSNLFEKKQSKYQEILEEGKEHRENRQKAIDNLITPSKPRAQEDIINTQMAIKNELENTKTNTPPPTPENAPTNLNPPPSTTPDATPAATDNESSTNTLH